MTTAAVLNYLAAASATGATVVAVQGGAGAAQDWTVLGLLAAVVLGIGARMIAAVDRNTTATVEQTKQIELLAQQLADDRHSTERAIGRLQDDVKQLRREAS